MSSEYWKQVWGIFKYLSYELHCNLIIKWNLWDPMLCVVTSNAKSFFTSLSFFFQICSSSILSIRCSWILSFFFLPFFTSIASLAKTPSSIKFINSFFFLTHDNHWILCKKILMEKLWLCTTLNLAS